MKDFSEVERNKESLVLSLILHTAGVSGLLHGIMNRNRFQEIGNGMLGTKVCLCHSLQAVIGPK